MPMHYEWTAEKAGQLAELLEEFVVKRDLYNDPPGYGEARSEARKAAEVALKRLGPRLVGTQNPDDASLSFSFIEASASGPKSQGQYVREAWMNNPINATAIVPQPLGGLPAGDPVALAHLPRHSFLLRLGFRLVTSYISKDDTAFHVLDNPVRKEWLFRVPAVASTTWKGGLRATFWQRGHRTDKDPLIKRLFGFATDEDDGKRGCLIFFPTYFEAGRVVIEMINPHERATGIGKAPIPFEAVGAGSVGDFWLLYAPLEASATGDIAGDLRAIADALEDLLTRYGIGAKVSSGFGKAAPLGGRLILRAALPAYGSAPEEAPEAAATPPGPAIAAEDEWMLPFLTDSEGGLVSPEEFLKRLDDGWPAGRGKKPKGKWTKYERFYREQRQLREAAEPVEQPEEPPAAAPDPELFIADFADLAELTAIAGHIGRHLAPAAAENAAEEVTP